MKKQLLIIAVMLALAFCLKGCGTANETNNEIKSKAENASMFVEIEQTHIWRIVYHRDTKVMYAVSRGVDNLGNFTPLYNADGTLQVYEGGE